MSCLNTAIPHKKLLLTRIELQEERLEINNVLVSRPNLFLGEFLSIHGVLAPFTRLNSQEIDDYARDVIESPNCSFPAPHWRQALRALYRNRFMSFAVGLNSFLPWIVQDYPQLQSGTIFAMRDIGLNPNVSHIIRMHILPVRYNYSELSGLPDKTKIPTLLKGFQLEIRATGTRLAINGVPISMPDVSLRSPFAVHGILRPFEDYLER